VALAFPQYLIVGAFVGSRYVMATSMQDVPQLLHPERGVLWEDGPPQFVAATATSKEDSIGVTAPWRGEDRQL
jgi:hypothetical protein